MSARAPRNDRCPCGSGKKFKRCCGQRAGQTRRAAPDKRPPAGRLFSTRTPPPPRERRPVTPVEPPADPATPRAWQELHLDLTDGGTNYRAVILYSTAWIKTNSVRVGEELLVKLPGALRGEARVVGIFDTIAVGQYEGQTLSVYQVLGQGPPPAPSPEHPVPGPDGRTELWAPWRVWLNLDKGGGDRVEIVLLRSLEWVRANQAHVGRTVWLDLEEMGAVGEAVVVKVEPCTELEAGDGWLVTGTFRHTAAEVGDLAVEGEPGPIGVTPGHPLWSADRGAWVPAGELRESERLLALDGSKPCVRSFKLRGRPEPVYNIEVEGEHAYRVGRQGLLVHNASFAARPYWPSSTGNDWGVYDLTNKVWVEFAGGRYLGDARWASGQAQAVAANSALQLGCRPVQALPIAIAHIVGLQWNGTKQNIEGGHSRPTIDGQPFAIPGGSNTTVKVIAPRASASAPYPANIQLEIAGAIARNTAGQPLQKASDMFPDGWNQTMVEDAIKEAFLNAYDLNRPNGWRGRTFIGNGGGILIIGFVANSGADIASAFPKI